MIFASFLVHSFIVELGRAWKGKKERKKKNRRLRKKFRTL